MATRAVQLNAYLLLFLSPSASLLSNSTNVSSTPAGHYIAQPLRNCSSFSVCWLHRPPYLIKDSSTGNITGIFHEAMHGLLSKCCGNNSSFWINYSHETRNISELTKCMDRDFDFVFPVLSSQVKSGSYAKARFQNLLRSPGIAVIKSRNHLERQAKLNVIREFFQTWTVLVLALLLNAIFGILIWFLDSRTNAEQFPRGFCRGSLEGIWWAFVTMTTVGYGDKAPKFLLARVLSVVWMFMGVTVMAYLTAIITTALTSGSVTGHAMIVNTETLGVLADSQGYIEGMKQGANVKPYDNLEALSRGVLNGEVEGMLLDVFSTAYSFNKDVIQPDLFEQVRILEFPFLIGFYMNSERSPYALKACVAEGSEQQFNFDIYPTVLKHIQGPTVRGTEGKRSWKTNLSLFTSNEYAFQLTLYILLSVLAALVVMGLVWELFTRKKRQNFKLKDKGNKRDNEFGALLMKKDIKRMMGHICEVEKTFKKILELKEAYKMDDYWSDQGTPRETNLSPIPHRTDNL